jgi:hypothetical protein
MLGGLSAVAPSYGIRVVNGAVVGCGIVSDTLAPSITDNVNFAAYTHQCKTRVARIETAALNKGKPDIVLWGSTDEGYSIVNPPSGTKVLRSGTRAWKATMLQRIEERVRQFTATGAKVILLLEPPEAQESVSKASKQEDRRYARMNTLLEKVAAQDPTKVATVDLDSRVCPSGPPCPYRVDRIAVRPDNLHYLPPGSLWVAEWLVPQIVAAAKALH